VVLPATAVFQHFVSIVFIGGGNMALALVGGMLQQGVPKTDVQIVDVSAQARARFAEMGIPAHEKWDGQPGADAFVFAVKPQQLKNAVLALKPLLASSLLISIAAGVRSSDIARWLGGHTRIVRVMPNTPALIGAGISGMFATDGVGEADRKLAETILGAAGKYIWFDKEHLLDAVTAVSGSGPAYVFYFIEALEEAARALDLDETVARQLAIETFLGASRLAEQSSESPAALRAKVTSKGGTTQSALEYMESEDVKSRVIAGVKEAARRARELGEEFGND
jgi:pyrroline-5-carboxylate reductase